MAICPKCKKEIETLTNFVSGEKRFNLFLNSPDYTDYEEVDFYEDNKVNDYECPECNEVLFTDENEAIEFLKNKDELQELIVEKLNKSEVKNDK